MFTCDLGHILTTRHSREFIDAEIALHPLDLGSSPSLPGLFTDDEVAIREGGDLRQMRNAEDLMLRRQFSQHSTHALCDRAADAGVDLIEHQGRWARAQDETEGQHRAGEFAARGDLGQRLGVMARVGGEQECDVVAGVPAKSLRKRRDGRRLRAMEERYIREMGGGATHD